MFGPSFTQPYQLGRKMVRGRFVIPSGIRCTHASTIGKCFREAPQIGVITTKSIGAQPRRGYREPIYARYAPGCYINAVGLANPGAAAYLAEFDGITIPEDKFLLVSIIGTDVESFVEAALTLKPIADGFELNMSCPHAKGYGAEIGQDTELMLKITEAVVKAAHVPVFVKLSSTLPNLAAAAEAVVTAGAAGLTLINTVGPALAAVGTSPILSNRLGGLSGDGIRPMGLRAVEQARRAVGSGPVIIGMGGIASAEHVKQYAAAGADLFGIGSALTGLDSLEMRNTSRNWRPTCARGPIPDAGVRAKPVFPWITSGRASQRTCNWAPRCSSLSSKTFLGRGATAIWPASSSSCACREWARNRLPSFRARRKASSSAPWENSPRIWSVSSAAPKFCCAALTARACPPFPAAP